MGCSVIFIHQTNTHHRTFPGLSQAITCLGLKASFLLAVQQALSTNTHHRPFPGLSQPVYITCLGLKASFLLAVQQALSTNTHHRTIPGLLQPVYLTSVYKIHPLGDFKGIFLLSLLALHVLCEVCELLLPLGREHAWPLTLFTEGFNPIHGRL